MLTLNNITKRFNGVTAVDSVSLEIPSGQFVGVIGKSGAGKSTLLRMINLLTGVSGGELCFNDERIDGLRGRELNHWRSQCAMIFQQFNLVERLDVLTNVMLGRLHRMSTVKSLLCLFNDSDRIDAIKTLEWLGLFDSITQRAGTLSGGQQQRVAIARALYQEPKVILADEPIASLDPLNAQKVMDALQSIHAQYGMTIITNLHTLHTARHYCQRIIGMTKGKVVFDGPPSDLTPAAIQKIYDTSEALDESTTSVEFLQSHAHDKPLDVLNQPVLVST